MLTLPKVNRLVQHLVDNQVPQNLRHRIACGIQALSLQACSSVNVNGRSLAAKRKTDESRVYRVLHDERTVPLLMRVLLSLLPKSPLLHCSLDHSQFGPFCIAVLSVSLRKGRAIPLWCQVNISEAALIAPLLTALEALAALLPEDQKLVLVMDRWFCGPKLFDLICSKDWYFICRAKYDRRGLGTWGGRCSISHCVISHPGKGILGYKRGLQKVRSHIPERLE